MSKCYVRRSAEDKMIELYGDGTTPSVYGPFEVLYSVEIPDMLAGTYLLLASAVVTVAASNGETGAIINVVPFVDDVQVDDGADIMLYVEQAPGQLAFTLPAPVFTQITLKGGTHKIELKWRAQGIVPYVLAFCSCASLPGENHAKIALHRVHPG